MTVDPILVALRVAEALEACRVRYLIGGSLASSMSGEPRSTLDIDMVVALTPPDIQPFVERLGEEFYSDGGGDPECRRTALQREYPLITPRR